MENLFLLKKFIAYFLEPFGMIFFLFSLGLLFLFLERKKGAKIFLSLSLSLLFIYSYPPFSNFLVSHLENKYDKYEYTQDVKYIHVLGNGHNTDITQPLSSQISDAGMKRNIEGILIHLEMKKSQLIFTGYKGKTNISNAKMNMNLALSLGVKEESVIFNASPKDTKEEALFTRSLVGHEPFILVTSAMHMPRAILLFESLGMNPIPAPTNFYKKENSGYFKAPNLSSLYKSRLAIHEYIGITWAKIRLSI